jgi:hypothetical protein
VKSIRYGLLLPLLHLVISLPVIYYEEASTWRYLPRLQIEEDFEKTNPEPAVHAGPQIAWEPCYEYRASTADRLIFAVEFPSGLFIAPHGGAGCNPTLLRPLLQKLKGWVRVKTRLVLLDFLLVLGIVGQWGLVGRSIDRQREQGKPARSWIVLAATITISGIVMAVATFVRNGPLEFVTAILSLIALIAWLALLFVLAVRAARWILRFSRRTRATDSG